MNMTRAQSQVHEQMNMTRAQSHTLTCMTRAQSHIFPASALIVQKRLKKIICENDKRQMSHHGLGARPRFRSLAGCMTGNEGVLVFGMTSTSFDRGFSIKTRIRAFNPSPRTPGLAGAVAVQGCCAGSSGQGSTQTG